jgi:hypothetical protein
MAGEIPQMLLPLVLATAILLASLISYGIGMHIIVRVLVRLIRRGHGVLGFWKSIAAITIVTLIKAAAHLTQIALWAVVFLLCGQVPTLETAFYFSAQNFTALGGDIQLSERWRLLSPLEAMEGILFFGLSTAVLFAIMSQLIAERLRTETGYRGQSTNVDFMSRRD